MEIITKQSHIEIPEYLKEHFALSELLFFDIETTGFAAKHTQLYLIGCLYFENNQPVIKQWFANSKDDETLILCDFFEFSKKFKYLLHYNGTGFDMPYLLTKCKNYQLSFTFDHLESLDIYKILSPFKPMLKLENLKQKSVESYLEIQREDTYHGGELIQVYTDYCKTSSEEAKKLLLLHNHDDLEGLLKLSPMLAFSHFNLENSTYIGCKINDYVSYHGIEGKEAIFHFRLSNALPKQISFSKQDYYFSAHGKDCKLKVKAYTGELKYFYSDYKNYYYLPKEDTAIHKSVAFYVDKDFRTRAKAANCYSKKTGIFLPQYKEVVSPYFKIDYFDKILYFEACDSALESETSMLSYIYHILAFMLK